MNAALAVAVSEYRLTVDAAETVRAVLDTGHRRRGQRLAAALAFASRDSEATAVYPAPPFIPLDLDQLDPARCVLPDIAAGSPCDVVRRLATAGYLTTHHVWRDTSGQTYADDGRTLTAIRVLRAFALARVEYHRTDPRSLGNADRWAVTERTPVVGRGWYLLGEIGDHRSDLVGATGLHTWDADPALHPDTAAELLTYRVAEIEGFPASTCLAGCARCGARWTAEQGSWHFHPDPELDTPTNHADRPAVMPAAFDFDDAADFDDNAIRCPHCGLGRVGFTVL
jgi:hypothetical protein